MKKITTFISAMAFSIGVFAQAPLPTSENFNAFTSTAMQPGWSTNIGGTFTYATGVSGTAAKLDLTGEYVQVNTADAMGAVTFYLKSWAASGFTTFTGTFSVEESVAGSTWTSLATYTSMATVSTSSYLSYTVNPASTSRYIRFIFTSKQPNYNIGLDDINITAAPVTAQEINLKQGSSTILTGSSSALFSSPVGTPSPVNFTIENIGTVSTLSISSIVFSGPAAADFSITAPASLPTTVAPSSNIPLTLSFNPSASGSRSAIMTINNNDADESAYVINLNGIGGTSATEPASQPTALLFSGIKSYRAKANFTAAAGTPNGYLILKKQSTSAITDVPVDGVAYQVGDAIGTSKVIYSGNATTIGLSNVYAGLQYQLAIYAYNGSGVYTNYNQTAPLTNNFTSLATMQPVSKYTSLNVTNPTFLSSLTALIFPHTSTFYGNYDETMVKLFSARDTTAGQKVITCVYSSENYTYTPPFAWGYMSREHSYCHNWMPSNPADVPERQEYNDQHHLFPTNQTNVNAVRSNYPQGEVVTVTGTYMNCRWGLDANGKSVFEPRASHKGDFARAIMYMATAYNGQLKGTTVMNWKLRNPISGTIPYGQDQNILKKWHYQDPPDSYEIARNDFLDSLQGNRNPYIDSMRYACYVDFSNMTYIASPSTAFGCPVAVGIKENVLTQFEYVLAPNPTSGAFYLLIDAKISEQFKMNITDVAGRIVYTKMLDITNGFNTHTISDIQLSAGVYFVNLSQKNETITRKLIIN